MYIVCIVLILIASVLIILSVLAQNPKGGMAANFGASNQVMGVRQTSDFLEKFTWTLAISILVLSLVATMTMPKGKIAASRSGVEAAAAARGTDGNNLLLNNQMGIDAIEAAGAETEEELTPEE
ncbi:MAG: preprotein translocase subunit SecG [Rikenellaceae bacterium]|nr:preprotein translocase subunit SecG [Rikenellaceae bacterium]